MADPKRGTRQRGIEALKERVEDLRRRAAGPPPLAGEVLAEALEELSASLEELHVAEEELRAASEALQTERQRYEDLFHFAPDGYLVTDAAGNIQEANRTAAALLNLPAQHLEGKPLALFVAKADRKRFRTRLSRLGAQALLCDWQLQILPRRRPSFPAAVRVASLPGERGRPVALRWLIRDLSERRLAEERFQTLIESSDDPIVSLDPEGVVTYLNPAGLRLLGLPASEVVGRHYGAFLPEGQRREEVFAAVLAGRQLRQEEMSLARPAGDRVHLSISARTLRDSAGRVIGVWGSARDVTERRRLQEMGNARRVSEERAKWEQERARWEEQRADWLAAILDQMPVGVVIVSAPEGRTLLANRALERLLDTPSRRNLRDHCRTWQATKSDGTPIPPGELPRVRALRGERVAGEELIISHSNGQRVQLMVSAAPLMEEGRITAGVVVMADISGQKQVQRQLEEAGRLKDEFLSMASHELKTPITSIKIYSELVTRRPEVAAKRLPELMATLNRQADQLVSLVDDLLEVSRLELGRMPIELRRLDLAALVRRVCKSPQYDARQLSCPPPDLSLMVEGDPVRLEQVLSNLLDNAVKYSPRGGPIWVRLEQGAGHALIEVEDRGIGIPPQHLPHVFERFYKPGPQQAVYSGLGVGLYISKEIVERHRGRIWAESQEGQGSKFVVELPLAERL